MYKQAFMNFDDTSLIVFGFFLFMMTFLGTFLWTFYVQDKKFYQEISTQPLKGDN